ncbi:MAG: hypothetical protein WC273_00420 [Dehalococcoidia bacterium]
MATEQRDISDSILDQALGPRQQVLVKMEAEDLRALLARCLLFVASGKDAPLALQQIRVEFSAGWAIGTAADGYTLAVQKIACESDANGVLMLHAYDAARILGAIPRPHGEDWLGPVSIDFISGGTREQPRPVNITYRDGKRITSYSCEAAPHPFPDVESLLSSVIDTIHTQEPERIAQFAVQPEFIARVAKATEVAKDQSPMFVRWYSPAQGKSPQVARFSLDSEHDEFIAVLMPVYVEWDVPDGITFVLRRITDTSGKGTNLHPQAPELPL